MPPDDLPPGSLDYVDQRVSEAIKRHEVAGIRISLAALGLMSLISVLLMTLITRHA